MTVVRDILLLAFALFVGVMFERYMEKWCVDKHHGKYLYGGICLVPKEK